MTLTSKLLFRRGLLQRFIKKKNNDCIRAFVFSFFEAAETLFLDIEIIVEINSGNSLLMVIDELMIPTKCPRNKASF